VEGANALDRVPYDMEDLISIAIVFDALNLISCFVPGSF